MKTVLITGATGDVGTHLARELAGKYKLRLSDRRPIKAKNFMKADITKMADCLRISPWQADDVRATLRAHQVAWVVAQAEQSRAP